MKKLFLFLLTVITISLCASAQTRTVKGTVLDAGTDEPLPGVSVKAGGNVGVATDLDGKFTITVPQAVTKLTFSFIGYKDQTLPIANNMEVKLVPAAEQLDEVIAVAYGVVKKSEYTGSAGVVKAAQLEDALVTTVTNALAGKVAGVQTQASNGQPGERPKVLIRGVGSINASTSPLYVVDGVPYDGDIAAIPATDIDAMTVLKDAASAALYGARGANGVILITTKRGKEGAARVSLDARWGANSRAVPRYDVITDARQYLETIYAAHHNDAAAQGLTGMDAHKYALGELWPSIGYQTWTAPAGQTIIGTDGRFNLNATPGYFDPKTGYYYIGDDWNKEQLTNGLRQEYNLSISGGTDKIQYYVAASYLNDEGIIQGSSYERLSTRASVDYQAKPWLKIGTNLTYTYVNSGYPGAQTDSGSTGNAFLYANSMAPVYPVYVRDQSGAILRDPTTGKKLYDYGDDEYGAVRNYMNMGNPAGDLAYNTDENLMDIFDAKWYAVLTPVKGLTITGNVGLFVDNTRNHAIGNPFHGQSAEGGGSAIQVQTRLRTLNLQGLAEYQRTFAEKHNAGIMVGYESYDLNNELVEAIGYNLYNPYQWAVNNTIDRRRGYGEVTEYATRGIFGRIKYNFDEKYFFMGSYRRDASSRFHPDKRWGNFWSVSGAWEIAKEDFMADLSDVFDLLKFKVSFGQNGNDNIGNYYAYLDQYTMNGSDGVFNDASLSYKGNPDITWETSNNFNIGVDYSLLSGMVSGSLEYYSRQTSDMLFNIPTSPSLGYSSIPKNVGSMRNNGFEIDVNYRPINTKNITWDINLNVTLPSNKVLKLSPDILDAEGNWITGSRIFHEGESMYQLYLPKYAGVDPETGAALYWARDPIPDPEDPKKQLVIDGIAQWSEEEHTTTNASDARNSNRVKTGNLMPKAYGGFGTTLNAYGFDLSLAFTYQLGGKILDYGYQSYMHGGLAEDIGMNLHKDILNAWTPENKNTNVPALSTTAQFANYANSDRWLTSSNYLSLNNITFGYTLPEKVVNKLCLNSVRVYFSAENVALWSKRKGFDPRQGFVSSVGYTYSPIRCFSGGLRLSF